MDTAKARNSEKEVRLAGKIAVGGGSIARWLLVVEGEESNADWRLANEVTGYRWRQTYILSKSEIHLKTWILVLCSSQVTKKRRKKKLFTAKEEEKEKKLFTGEGEENKKKTLHRWRRREEPDISYISKAPHCSHFHHFQWPTLIAKSTIPKPK